MLDGIIAETGNSRTLRTIAGALQQYPTYESFIQALVKGEFPIDWAEIIPDGWVQQGTPLNKANLLTDATAALLDLPSTATPNDMFSALANRLKTLSSYVVCDTAGSTAAKTVTVNGFELNEGVELLVRFSNANTASNPTLNISGTGAKPIKKYGTTAVDAYRWYAGAVVHLVYDGTNWIMVDGTTATTTYYGVTKLSSSTSSTSTALAATPSAVKSAYDLASQANNKITYGTADLTAGSSALATGTVYLVYE